MDNEAVTTKCRYVFAGLLFFGSMTSTCLQATMNVAIVAMVNKTMWTTQTLMSDDCKTEGLNVSDPQVNEGEFQWDPYTQGLLLGANSYGSIFTHLLGGYLAVHYGGKWIFGGGIFVEALFSIITPLSARMGVGVLFAVRFLFGLAEGVIVPASIALISRWSPVNERSTFIGLSVGGVFFGNGLASITTGFLSNTTILGGWPAVFYISGGLGCVWFLLWAFLIHGSPEKDPRISKSELNYIQASQETSEARVKVPWCAIFRSLPYWSFIILYFCYSWVVTTFNTSMPLYLETVQRIPIELNGLFIGLVYPGNLIGSLLGGLLADTIRKRTSFSTTAIRKSFSTAAFLGSGFCFLCVLLIGCDKILLFITMFMTKLFVALNSGGCSVVLVDMAPQYAGILSGLTSTITGTTGFICPLVTGLLTNTDVTNGRWAIVIMIAVIISIFGLLVFLLFGSAEVQQWAQLESTDEKASLVKSVEVKAVVYGSNQRQ